MIPVAVAHAVFGIVPRLVRVSLLELREENTPASKTDDIRR